MDKVYKCSKGHVLIKKQHNGYDKLNISGSNDSIRIKIPQHDVYYCEMCKEEILIADTNN